MVGRQAPTVRLVITVVACNARMEHLPHSGRQVPLLLEVLGHGGEVAGVGAPVGVEVIEPGRVRTSGCEEGSSARSTYGLLGEGPSENGSSACKKVEVWSESCCVAITS